MFQDVEEVSNTLKEIRAYAEDIVQLSDFLFKTFTDEEFADKNQDSQDLYHKRLYDEIFKSKEGLMKQVNKLKRMV